MYPSCQKKECREIYIGKWQKNECTKDLLLQTTLRIEQKDAHYRKKEMHIIEKERPMKILKDRNQKSPNLDCMDLHSKNENQKP